MGVHRRKGADIVNLFLLPCLLALLPWRLAFFLLRRMAGVRAWQGAEVTRAWWVAREHFPALEEDDFRQRLRLLQLVERVDTWLSLLRSARWWRNQIDVVGDWPDDQQSSMLLTFHWGAGFWVWRTLLDHRVHAHFLAKRPQAEDLGSSPIALHYAALRVRVLRRIGCAGVILSGGSTPHILAALDEGRSVMGMLDLPATGQQRRVCEPLLDGEVVLPSGLAHLAVAAGVPVLLVSCALDMATGRRRLRIEPLPAGLDADAIMRRYVLHLQQRLQEEPAHWQLWSAAGAMLQHSRPGADPPPV